MIIRRREMVTSKVFVCLVCLCSLFIKQSEQCIVRERGVQGLPSFSNYHNDAGSRITLHHQAIIPSYEFTCCGNITEWGVDVQPGGGADDRRYTLDLQVWRPSPTVDDSTGAGQYSLVGNNRFTSISLSGDVAEVTPLSRNQVQFRPGDVLGFYVEEAKDANNKGVNVLTTASFSNERVWYASVTTLLSSMGCPVSAGSSGVLNTQLRGAPVISIASETSSCPQTPSPTTPQPTNPPTVPTDPESIVTTTTEPVTDESSSTDPETDTPPTTDSVKDAPVPSPTDLVTEDSTTPDMVTDNPSGVTTTSEAVNDQQISSGLVVGIVVASLLAIVLALALVAVAAVTLTKRRKTDNCFSSVSESRAISNIGYGTYEVKQITKNKGFV